MMTAIQKFRSKEDGAVTVDFVVLTAAIVVLGLIVGTAITTGSTELAAKQEASLKDRPLGTEWFK
ncbi:hypothetical protein [Yoonia sp. SDW83-1]|uniref:hypothetical protein n=1 Tax=Yoonia sp. SDW83-1 TaxID=3366945 RepID=UPI00398C3095